MNQRVEKLRRESLDQKPWVSLERARLVTEFYETTTEPSAPLRRACALAHIMKNKSIWIGDGELIVGERGPSPKGTPTFPELCCHSMEDLEILNGREKISYAVDETARQVQQKDVIPYWRGRSIREMIFAEMTLEWKDAYEAGIFTEFMEQRAPGHGSGRHHL